LKLYKILLKAFVRYCTETGMGLERQKKNRNG
jgi:hypothetical protein